MLQNKGEDDLKLNLTKFKTIEKTFAFCNNI
jgi:hypothetical protein